MSFRPWTARWNFWRERAQPLRLFHRSLQLRKRTSSFRQPSSLTFTPESAALRAKAMPLIAEDPTRVPDHILSGPELPLNETVRARFFGEC